MKERTQITEPDTQQLSNLIPPGGDAFQSARAVGVFALAAALACAQTLGVNNYGRPRRRPTSATTQSIAVPLSALLWKRFLAVADRLFLVTISGSGSYA